MTKETDKIITKDRIAQRIILELLLEKTPFLTIKEAKELAWEISKQIRNAFFDIEADGLSLTDQQANDVYFWIAQVKNAGKDFNQPVKKID